MIDYPIFCLDFIYNYYMQYAFKNELNNVCIIRGTKGFLKINKPWQPDINSEIEVTNNKHGKPSIKLKGNTLTLLKKRTKNKKYQIDLSLSDDLPWAQATVIISYKK